MKIKISKKGYGHRKYTQVLPDHVCEALDAIAKQQKAKYGRFLSRNRLVEAILEQVLKDPKFVLEID